MLVVVLLFAACAVPAPAPAAPAPAAPAAVDAPAAAEVEIVNGVEQVPVDEHKGELTLAIWGQIDADPNHAAYSYHEILQQWNELHPDIELKYELVGGASVPERFTWIKTRMLSATLPDVVMIYFPGEDYQDPDLVYDFVDDLQKPNPYSDNPTWLDDFPFDGLILKEWGDAKGERYFIGPTLSGDTGVTTFLYNKDIFDEVGVTPPTTWAEMVDVSQKIKDAGYTPFFQPLAGPLGWLIGWVEAAMMDQLMYKLVETCDFEVPFERMSIKEMTWCVKSGNFRADDPRFLEAWRIIKEYAPYWQDGYMAPPPEGDPWAAGEVAMQHTMNLWLGRVMADPNINFEWGTFYQPPLTTDTSDLVEEVRIRRVGNLGAAASGSQFLMVPTTTVDNGMLGVARDLVQYTTAPAQLDYWCEHQPIPCFEPGTPVEEVYPDQPETWTRMRGFFEPGSFENGVTGFALTTFGQDAGSLSTRLLQEYLGDAITLEEAAEELQVIMEEEADKAIRENPEWNADGWDLTTPPTS